MPTTRRGPALFPLTLTALGVVYGDIGTSPLYALRECFFGSHAVRATAFFRLPTERVVELGVQVEL